MAVCLLMDYSHLSKIENLKITRLNITEVQSTINATRMNNVIRSLHLHLLQITLPTFFPEVHYIRKMFSPLNQGLLIRIMQRRKEQTKAAKLPT